MSTSAEGAVLKTVAIQDSVRVRVSLGALSGLLPGIVIAKVFKTALEPALKAVGTVMNRMGIDTSLWRCTKHRWSEIASQI